MIIKEALYNNLKRLLVDLSIDSDKLEGYSLTLDNNDKANELTNLAENVEAEIIRDLDLAIGESTLLSIKQSYLEIIRDYKDKYSDFPEARFDEIIFILLLLNTLNSTLEDELDFNEEIDNSIYSLIDFDNDKFGTNIFHFDDFDQPNNSFVFFNFEKIDEIIEYFQQEELTIQSKLIIQLISKIGTEETPLSQLFYALIFNETARNKAKSKSYIAIQLITKGKIFHIPYEYSRDISTTSMRSISVRNNYHQFKDTLTILSEYNSQTDILDKFLRLYHVIENFMFKSPLVNLERRQNGKPFSFRDFQRIHTNISRSETDSLKKLVQKVFICEQQAGTNFETYSFNKLADIVVTQSLITEQNFNLLISYLGVEKKQGGPIEFSELTIGSFPKVYSDMLYSLRCAVVHNKESEFHLTHEILFTHSIIGNAAQVLLEEFLIPTMEEIIIFLLTENENDIVWFSNHTLMLWEQN